MSDFDKHKFTTRVICYPPDNDVEPDDQYTYVKPRSFAELLRVRKDTIDHHERNGYDEFYKWDRTFTCDHCISVHKCVFAFDAYNTDGDCLAEK